MLGREYPKTASTLNTLGNIHSYQGKRREAEHIFSRVLVIRRKVLGRDHPLALNSWNNLGNVYEHQGKHDDDKSTYRCVFLTKNVLGRKQLDCTTCADTP